MKERITQLSSENNTCKYHVIFSFTFFFFFFLSQGRILVSFDNINGNDECIHEDFSGVMIFEL